MVEQDFLTPPVFNGCSSDGTIRSTRDLRPAHFLFKIESYSLLCETGAETIESMIFKAGGYKWNLCLYPKGNSKGNDHISLYLKVADTTSLPCGWEVNAMFTFFVFDKLRDKYLSIQDGTIRRFHETTTEWGVSQLLSLEIFNDISKGYLVDDSCVFGLEVFVLKHTGRIDYLSMAKKPSNNTYSWKIKKVPTLDKVFYCSEGFSVQGTLRKILAYPKVDSVSRGKGHVAFCYCFGNGCLTSNQKVHAECRNGFEPKMGYNKEYNKRVDSHHDMKSHLEYTGTIRSTRDFRPAHFLLKIESYSLLCEKGAETYESGSFEAGGHKWKLCFYPKGNRKIQVKDHISLYLKVVDTSSLPCGWEVNAKLTFFVFDQLRDKYLTIQDGSVRRFHQTKTEWGMPQLLSLDILNDFSKGYLVDDCCVFGVEVFVLKHTGRMECLSVVKEPCNNIHTLKIKNFSTLDKHFYYSDAFPVEGILWKFIYNPNWMSSSKGETFCLYLYNAGNERLTSNQKVYAECKLRVKNQLDIKRHVELTARGWFSVSGRASARAWGFHMISLKDLKDISKGYILNDDILIVEAEIMVIDRPEYQLKEDAETPRNSSKPVGESIDTLKVTRDIRGEETVRASNLWKTFRSAGWDFSIGGPPNTGTVRSASKPPQVRERKLDITYNQATPRPQESGNAVKEFPEVSFRKGTRESYSDENEDNYHRDETSVSGSGTIVIRSPRGSQSSAFVRDSSSLSSSEYTSCEDASTSGTIVLLGQHDDSGSPQTPRSRLGIQGKPSAASAEDSTANLAEAKAAIQAGFIKGNSRDRSALSKNNSPGNKKRRDQMSNSSDSSRSSRDYFDARKAFSRTGQSNDEEISKIASSSIPLSMLLIPSLKEVITDDSEGSVMRAVSHSLLLMERANPGSCEALVCKLLDQLACSKESSMKDMQELAACLFNKGKVIPEDRQNTSPGTNSRKKLQHKDLNSDSNLSPLARFLVSRWQSQKSQDLNPS